MQILNPYENRQHTVIPSRLLSVFHTHKTRPAPKVSHQTCCRTFRIHVPRHTAKIHTKIDQAPLQCIVQPFPLDYQQFPSIQAYISTDQRPYIKITPAVCFQSFNQQTAAANIRPTQHHSHPTHGALRFRDRRSAVLSASRMRAHTSRCSAARGARPSA